MGGLAGLAPVERVRAKARLEKLSALVAQAPKGEDDVRRVASALRSMFRNRAERILRKAAVADLPGLREDSRWESVVRPAVSRIASSDVEGYLAEEPHCSPSIILDQARGGANPFLRSRAPTALERDEA
jgi:hypothetical protein